MATGAHVEEAGTEPEESNLCPRGCGVELRQHYEDLICIVCGYEGDGQAVLLGEEPETSQARWDYDTFPQTHVITIYRCRSYFSSAPEFEPLDIHVTVERTSPRMQKSGRKYRLLGLYGGEGAYWPDELSPQSAPKGGISKMRNLIRQELRQAILEAICKRLGVMQAEVMGLADVIRADTLKEPYEYSRGYNAGNRRGFHLNTWRSKGG